MVMTAQSRSGSRSRSPARLAPGAPPLCSGRQTDFGGARVNVVQVGLGSHATFLQNLAGKAESWDYNTDVALKSTSDMRPEHLTGIGVEPVLELVDDLVPLATAHFPHVALAQVALGERDTSGTEVHVLTRTSREALLRQVQKEEDRKKLEHQFQYMTNMSSVGGLHPEMPTRLEKISESFGIKIWTEQMCTEVWTWRKLARAFNFGSCELLLLDTEGHDAAILRSMIAHCREEEERNGAELWPEVIQFESMGLCDRVEVPGTEWEIIKQLEECGYVLLHYSRCNSHLAHGKALQKDRVAKWAAWAFRCDECGVYNQFPFCSRTKDVYCLRCCCDDGEEVPAEEPLPPTLLKVYETLWKVLRQSRAQLYFVRGDGYVLIEELLASEHMKPALAALVDFEKCLSGSGAVTEPLDAMLEGRVAPLDAGASTASREAVPSSTVEALRRIVRASHAAKEGPRFQLWDAEGAEQYKWIRLQDRPWRRGAVARLLEERETRSRAPRDAVLPSGGKARRSVARLDLPAV